MDSRRWQTYRARPDDIVIATYSKCGTTWTQRIVDLLVFQNAAPRPIYDASPDRLLALAEPRASTP